MLHAIADFFGLTSQTTAFYMFWSGCATQISVLFAFLSLRAEQKMLRSELKKHDEKDDR